MDEPLLTQREVERRMYAGGIARSERGIEEAEASGRAHTNPYAKEIMQDYVLPLAGTIHSLVTGSAAGKRMAHVALLAPLDHEAVAYLTVRTVLSGLLGHTKDKENHQRVLAYEVGKTIHNELILAQIEDAAPELYHTLSRDLGRRLSKNERHRMTVFKLQAAKRGIPFVEWPIGARHQIGLWLLELVEQAGMVYLIDEPAHTRYKNQVPKVVVIADDILARIDKVKAYMGITSPVYGPMVEPPADWGKGQPGGFHTSQMRRTHPCLVRGSPSTRDMYREADMPMVYEAANTLQRTAWQVNTRVLDIIMEVGKVSSRGEIVNAEFEPKPTAPLWLTRGMDMDGLTEEQDASFRRWKRTMAEWYTDRKLSAVKYSRFYSASRSAAMFRDYPAIYFVYFADTRGRLYPMTYGLNPQGSDLQRGLLRFSEGKPVHTPEAIKWFHVQGANKYGFDKATLEDRVKWVKDRHDLMMHMAADPVNHTDWRDADKPLQFLAWVLEYAEWVQDKAGFLSHLPISMDGSCNGLQNLSALLRDEVGGRATNLCANAVMEDIYKRVAEAATRRMGVAEKTPMLAKWLEHGVERSAVKRAVMTTPYGVTKRSATKYVVEDYLKEGKAPIFDKSEYRVASNEVMEFVWPAIGDVVVKGREAMDWLRKCARVIVNSFKTDEEPVITWISPSGFPASQAYFEANIHRINTRLAGSTKIRVLSESDEADHNKHSSGMAPNFVHSMDAAHLHLSTVALRRAGVTALAMIHDDYGTHAESADLMFRVIREQFVAMYEHHDPIAEFYAKYPGLPKPPAKGSLDIREVLTSQFFFS